uniref:Uncharacterized protein n=1 Tax=Physcomitrium patens TaxID=3218 RepID=A9RXB6_PHYPA|nr:hypothetical protein PHYPA_018712 [Physcomitrium patens]
MFRYLFTTTYVYETTVWIGNVSNLNPVPGVSEAIRVASTSWSTLRNLAEHCSAAQKLPTKIEREKAFSTTYCFWVRICHSSRCVATGSPLVITRLERRNSSLLQLLRECVCYVGCQKTASRWDCALWVRSVYDSVASPRSIPSLSAPRFCNPPRATDVGDSAAVGACLSIEAIYRVLIMD